MNATSLLTYFAPLKQWLENANANDCLGWDDYCESYAAEYVSVTYETETSGLLNVATIADWEYNTNLTEHNAIVAVNHATFCIRIIISSLKM